MQIAYIFCPSYVLNKNKIKIPQHINDASVVQGDIFIAADSGIKTAFELNITPDVLLGDFDSYNIDDDMRLRVRPAMTAAVENIKIIKYPAIKNDTDSMLAVKYALGLGYKNIIIIGGLDGRIDHTFANLCLLKYIKINGGTGCITNGYNRITYLSDSSVRIYKEYQYVSVMPVIPEIRGVTLKGFKYNLNDAKVRFEEPYTVCNEISESSEYGEIIISDGEAFICECDDSISYQTPFLMRPQVWG